MTTKAKTTNGAAKRNPMRNIRRSVMRAMEDLTDEALDAFLAIDALPDEQRRLVLDLLAPTKPPERVQQRKAIHVQNTSWALERWRRLHGKQNPPLSPEKLAQRELVIAAKVLRGLEWLEPACRRKAKMRGVADILRRAGEKRTNANPVEVATEIADLAEVWEGPSVAGMTKAELRNRQHRT